MLFHLHFIVLKGLVLKRRIATGKKIYEYLIEIKGFSTEIVFSD